MSDSQINGVNEWGKQNQANGLPMLVLPSGTETISDSAAKLFALIAPTKKLFFRGGVPVRLVSRDDGLLALEILRAAAARSFIEKFARLVAWRKGEDNEIVLKPVVCAHEMADALLHSEEASKLLPTVRGLINCPILRDVNGKLEVAGLGYDEETKLLVTGGKEVPVVALPEAASALLALLAEFDFQSEGDKARAVASMISPALKAGGFIKKGVPADVAEADQSQSGKTYRHKVLAALYNERPSLVTSREGGVGSVDETFSQQLVSGRPFIQFDNFRGRFDSKHVEAFLTAEGSFPCRVPHLGQITVQPENYFVLLTSNGVDTTRDFANRSNIIRIRKKPAGFAFTKFAEGDLLERVRSRQAYYLGCIFGVIRAWHGEGKPVTAETRHDFVEWVQIVDWIVQQIFSLAPVMDGHRQAQERVSNPAMVWLRNVVLRISELGDLDRALIATDLFELSDSADIPIPGLRAGVDELKGKKVIGSIMAKIFGAGDTVEVDGFLLTREERFVARENGSEGGNFKSKTYTVTRV